MSIAKSRSGSTRRFQSTRRKSGGTEQNAAEGNHGDKRHGEGSTGGGACMKPDRTFGRTYLQRGFAGYKRPKRPKRTGKFGVKTWSAADELPGVTRPGLGEISAATPTGTKSSVVNKVQQRGGCSKSRRRGERHTMPASPTTIKAEMKAARAERVADAAADAADREADAADREADASLMLEVEHAGEAEAEE